MQEIGKKSHQEFFLCFWAQRCFSGRYYIARPGKIVFETILSALGGAAHFSESDVGTPEGTIRPALPWEHPREQSHPLWCFMTSVDCLTICLTASSRVIIKIIL